MSERGVLFRLKIKIPYRILGMLDDVLDPYFHTGRTFKIYRFKKIAFAEDTLQSVVNVLCKRFFKIS